MRYILVVLLSFSINCCFAQQLFNSSELAFYLKPLETKADPGLVKRGVYVGPHLMGDSITELRNIFESKYAYYKKSGGAYATEERVILKSAIYKAIIKIDKSLTKQITERPLLITECKGRMSTIYGIGIKLIRYQTDKVEADIKVLKSTDEMEKYLLSLKFN